ncbi:ABC transporter ATP-binding protein [Ruania halotolerans]|uniref:ABC transporter ATP-binding protein n=1 Tax=Ruania halotolerans TaxID=2897773 RepID=UPI001E63C1E6|nr:ABC transporter ATP-binding protein [Ruania halotolerans]UFU07291.1 energy-coupling factor ABC transporter ATP-binding protein [Ruania halotolerans]
MVLNLRDVGVHYPRADAPVVRDLDLDLAEGERLLLLGRSGSGKSSLLRALAGVVPGTIEADVTGTWEVCGHDPRHTAVPELARHVATLTQDPADQLCLPTVVDEVAFALENRAVPPEQIGPRVSAALEAVGAAHLTGRRTSELSGGEGQRVALAAALVARPELILLDEPTALLDPASAREVGRLLGNLPAASVLIEHRLDELGTLPERSLLLGPDGRVVAVGPTADLLADEDVAGTGTWVPAGVEVARAVRRLVGVRGSTGAASMTGTAGTAGTTGTTSATGAAGRPGRGDAPTHAPPSGPAALAEGLRTLDALVGPGEPAVRPEPGDVLLRADHLAVRRGEREVVRGVDLQVRAGTITAVLGVNGSGKSTLLLGLAGLLPADGVRGSAQVGMVFQNPEHQFLARSARAEVELGLGPGEIPDSEALAILDAYGLAEVADRDPFRLSGGQQRRLSLAAMTAMGDEVLLADEPTFGQDRRTTLAVAAQLRAVADRGGAVVLVSHDLRLVASLADQVLLLAAGSPVADGPTAEVLIPGVLARAGLRLPPLLDAWISGSRGDPARLPALLSALDQLAIEDAARRPDHAGAVS